MLDLQEHIPDALHDADREPCTSQLHARNVYQRSNILILNLFAVFTSASREVEIIFNTICAFVPLDV